MTNVGNLYTNYFLAGKSSVHISVTNNSSKKKITVKLYKLKSGKERSDTLIDTHKVNSGVNLNYYINNLDPNESYYLLFIAPADFTGYIE